jgi:filamentous hemagglutinin
MAVTRINNNQITDASAGNVYVGINAGTKLQDYSITAGKIANSLVYGSDLTVSGNLTVNGQTTTIDTVSTVIEDPVIVLASNQTGTPAVDIGFIGERGDQNNIAFVWDESADEFVTAFTTDLVTNTTVTISSYANFHTNDANIGGNITINGTTTLVGNIASALNVTGNITGGNLLTPGQVVATGNVSGGNVVSSALVSGVTVTASGNVNGGNVVSTALVLGATVTASGNVNGGNVVSTALVSGATVTASGNVSGGNLTTAGQVAATGNVSGGNIISSALVSGTTVTASGNVNGGNLTTAGQVVATGNVTGGNITTAGLVSAGTTITATGNVSGGNVTTAGQVTATGNITGGNLNTAGITSTGSLTASTTINATGNITGGNLSAGSGIISTTGNINGGNVNATTGVTATTVTATGNISGGNISTGGALNVATLETTGNALIGGNLIVQGNITYINIDDLRVEDPIIILGTGPNGTPLSADDGLDRGIFMEYYTTGLGNAFMGWDNSTGNMIIASNAYFTANDVVGINSYGTLEAGNLYIQSAVSTGNVSGGNVTTAGQVVATGNVSGGNLTTGGQVTATGNVSGGNIIAAGNVNSNQGFFSGNVTVVGTLTSTSNIVANTSGIFFGDAVTGNNAIIAGVPAFTSLGSNIVAQFSGNVNSYSQINFENISNGNRASTDYIATADNGTDSTNYADFGINSSTFNDPVNYPGYGPNDSYVHNNGGNLILNPESTGKTILMMVGGTATANVVANVSTTGMAVTGIVSATGNVSGGNLTTAGQVTATGNVSGGNLTTAGLVSAGTTITATGNVSGGNITTAGQVTATGNVTGGNVIAVALVTGANVTATSNVSGANVVGTTSVTGGNIVISGDNITDTNGRVNFNTAGADVDFAVNGDTVANVFYVDAGTGTASFGSSTQTTNAVVAFNATNSVLMPVGNVAQRPGTGVTGMLRFNTTADALEVYDNSQWTTVGVPSFTVIADEQFNGDGTTLVFTLGSSQTTASCIVSINGVVQIPTIAYSVSGTTLTFTEAPEPGDIIDVRQITTTTTVTTISNVSGNAAVGVSDTSNDVSVTGDLVVSGSVSASSFIGLDATTIANGTSSVSVIASGGNIRSNVGGSTVQTISAGLVAITGDLSVTGNATLSGNILGDRVVNGTTSFEIQTPSGNANISIGGTSNVAVFTTAGANIAGTLGVTGNISGGNLSGTSIVGTLLTSAQTNITSVGTLGSLTVTANVAGGNLTTGGQVVATGNITGGNIIATVDVYTPEIVKTGSNAVGNIGQVSNYFNTVFAQATSALYADLAEKYIADAEYTPGTVVVFGGDKEVTVTSTDADRAVAGVVSTNPSYIMNAGLEAEHVATVALTGRVPCRVTGTIKKGDMMVSAGYGLARAEADPRVGTVIGKALENHEGTEGVIEVVVGRF